MFEATLSFLGLGIQPPTPSWGNMLCRRAATSTRSPGGTWSSRRRLLITTLAFNLLGDGIRDALDPRTERVFAAAARPQARGEAQRAARRPAPATPTGRQATVPPAAGSRHGLTAGS